MIIKRNKLFVYLVTYICVAHKINNIMSILFLYIVLDIFFNVYFDIELT